MTKNQNVGIVLIMTDPSPKKKWKLWICSRIVTGVVWLVVVVVVSSVKKGEE